MQKIKLLSGDLKKCSFSRSYEMCEFFTFAGMAKLSHIENRVTKQQQN